MLKLTHVVIEKKFQSEEVREIMTRLMNHERSREIEFAAEDSYKAAVKFHRQLIGLMLVIFVIGYALVDYYFPIFGGDHATNPVYYIPVLLLYAIAHPRRNPESIFL